MPADPKLEVILAARDMSAQAFAQFQQRIDKISVAGLVKDLGGLPGILSKLALPATLTAGLKELWEEGNAFASSARKFTKIFTDDLGEASAILGTLSKGFQITNTEATKNLVTAKIFIENLGLIPQKAKEISVEVVKLSADIAKFYGAGRGEVMGAIESAMAGRYRAMKEYGITLNETMVANKAVSMGLAATTEEVTQGQKAFAALTLILEKSQYAIGTLARSTETAKGKLDGFKTWAKDAGEIISTYFLAKVENTLSRIEELYRKVSEVAAPSAATVAENEAEVLSRAQKTIPMMSAKTFFRAPADETLDNRIQQLKEVATRQRELASSTELSEAQKFRGIALPKVNPDDFVPDPEALKKAYEKAYGHVDWSYIWKNDPLDQARMKSMKSGGYMDYLKEDYLNTSKNYKELEKKFGEDVLKEEDQIRIFRIKAWQDEHDKYLEITQHTAEAVQDSWADLFFDAFTGKLKSLEDYFQAFYQSIAKMASQYLSQQAMSGLFGLFGKYGTPITAGDRIGAMFETNLPIAAGGISAKGNVFEPQGLVPFARGGVVNRPVIFPFAGGAGLMGEAGPEAIMPLARNSRGELGVKGGGGGTYHIYHITAMDSQSVVDALRRSGAVPALAAENYANNGIMRTVLRGTP